MSEVSSINSAAAIHSSIEIRNIIGKCIFYFSFSSTLNGRRKSRLIKLQAIDDVLCMPEPEQDTPHTSWRAVTWCVGVRGKARILLSNELTQTTGTGNRKGREAASENIGQDQSVSGKITFLTLAQVRRKWQRIILWRKVLRELRDLMMME